MQPGRIRDPAQPELLHAGRYGQSHGLQLVILKRQSVTFVPSGAGRRTALVEVFTPQGQSTSVILAGDGVFEPELVTLERTVQAGDEFVLGGSDYPANTELVVVFGDGAGDVVNVTTNGGGGFSAARLHVDRQIRRTKG